jgi:hypothetical protein
MGVEIECVTPGVARRQTHHLGADPTVTVANAVRLAVPVALSVTAICIERQLGPAFAKTARGTRLPFDAAASGRVPVGYMPRLISTNGKIRIGNRRWCGGLLAGMDGKARSST